MSAQIIQLSDHRKTRSTPPSSLIDLPLSIVSAYTEISHAVYLSVVNPAEHRLKAAMNGFAFIDFGHQR